MAEAAPNAPRHPKCSAIKVPAGTPEIVPIDKPDRMIVTQACAYRDAKWPESSERDPDQQAAHQERFKVGSKKRDEVGYA
jgi:hypothetical protein